MRNESITIHNALEDPQLIPKLEKAIPLWLREQKVWEDVRSDPFEIDSGIAIPFPDMFTA